MDLQGLGFPKMRATFLGVLGIRIVLVSLRGLHLGSPIYGMHQVLHECRVIR